MIKLFNSIFSITFLLLNIDKYYSLAEIPIKISSCKVKLSNGKFINLQSLDDVVNFITDNQIIIFRKVNLNEYNYLFNPCKYLKRFKFIVAN